MDQGAEDRAGGVFPIKVLLKVDRKLHMLSAIRML